MKYSIDTISSLVRGGLFYFMACKNLLTFRYYQMKYSGSTICMYLSFRKDDTWLRSIICFEENAKNFKAPK